MIKWKLRTLMAAKGMSNKELAELINYHEVTISKLRTLRMPSRLEDTTLSLLCETLECQPGDLLEYVPDDEDITDTEGEETPSPQTSNSRRNRRERSTQSKNTRALRAKHTKTRVAVWKDLRSPLTIKNNEKPTA